MAGSTGLEQQHLIARVCRKAVRDRGTSRTGADDNVIVGLHLSCSPSAPTLSTQALYAKGMIKPARGWRRAQSRANPSLKAAFAGNWEICSDEARFLSSGPVLDQNLPRHSADLPSEFPYG